MKESLTRKWRLILGAQADEEGEGLTDELDVKTDQVLSQLFDGPKQNKLKRSRPLLNEWLQDIRELFPQQQILFLQKKAIETLDLKTLLFEKEIIEQLTPDIDLIKTILLLKDQIPEENLEYVQQLVREYAEEIEEKIEWGLRRSLSFHHQKGDVTYHPRRNETDWKKTIKRNLKNYRPELNTIILQNFFGHERRRQNYPHIYLVVDSSASMTDSLIYTAIIGSVLAHVRTVETRLILFDSEPADLTDQLDDVVRLLFHIQLGGGTDITRALQYTSTLIRNPTDSYLFLISDLYDNFDDRRVLEFLLNLKRDGTTVHSILSMDEKGKSNYNKALAQALTNEDIPCYAADPAQFAETLSKALQ